MNKLNPLMRAAGLMSVAVLLSLQGCGLLGGGGRGDDRGELVGVPGREGFVQTIPHGMVAIPAGTFHMGQTDQDVAATQVNFNKQVTISGFFMDETEITNNEYRQFIESVMTDSIPNAWDQDYVMQELYPDTTVWVNDFSHHMGDPMMEYYYSHPAYDDYPVVGVDWEAAQIFSLWRTNYLNDYRASKGEFMMPKFRLPSEAEWEYAARGGRDMAKYPWGGPYIRNRKGCLLANYKPRRGNYYDDGWTYTAAVAQYFANDYGLYDMAGNVAEWTEDAYSASSVPVVWDLNPIYIDENEPRKVVRGGSWKDIAYYLQTGTRTYEYKDSTRSYIGFRCAMTYLGRSSGSEF
ncbi:SUMF1/EgtB/PvdO family nonheme iron enzyme [Xanthovirga aplysinae]|uniref:type IX secretion system lipoprotein PorK/GldK n=1 Tax=Xanthovirga aplysinae TaxID=2529853 RepID=UPI0012BC8D5A|nr:SUMF1/EgtB/PvdO family nonheme iron enzyme [Xanthovirga aplysinae]MTI33323.1 gliding motility lipoprotein GldK [Xanthovirga aplysinae]